MGDQAIDKPISLLNQLRQNNSELKTLTSVVKNMTEVMKNDIARSQLTLDHWNSFMTISEVVEKLLNQNSLGDEELNFLAELLRFLRNSCAGVATNQDFIMNSCEVLSWSRKVIEQFKDKKTDKEVTVLKCCLQLFGNLVCSNPTAKSTVWNLFLEAQMFNHLFSHDNPSVREYTMMILYNCMSDEAARHLITSRDGNSILVSLLETLCNDLVDWGILFLEFILKQEDFMSSCYDFLPFQSRLLVLDVITEHLSNSSENAYFAVHYSSINFIKDLFIQYIMNIVQICGNESADMKPAEIVKILCLLCAASVSDSYSHILKPSRELLEVALDTLKSVHFLGKKNANAFSCISNLKLTNDITKEEIEGNPSYCFKKNLIRLIGNLCYNCKDNQDLVRKLDGIPLLLDCCNLDARNPFIMQWCILAIRNLLEKNAENQAIFAGVSITGDLVDSSLIKELGFEVTNVNGKYSLKSIQTHDL